MQNSPLGVECVTTGQELSTCGWGWGGAMSLYVGGVGPSILHTSSASPPPLHSEISILAHMFYAETNTVYNFLSVCRDKSHFNQPVLTLIQG